MRLLAALIIGLLAISPARADDLFSRTELRCVIEYGGVWDFSVDPPVLARVPSKLVEYQNIDLDGMTANTSVGERLVAVRGTRSIVFAQEDVTTAIFAQPSLRGFPIVISNLESQRAGFCN
jgi:hypothetical protein